MGDQDEHRRRRIAPWHRPLWWLNGIAVLLLLTTYLAPHISPRSAWPLALLALTYPYQLVVHTGFIVWWSLFRRKRLLVSLIAVLAGWGHVGDHVQVFGREAPAREVQDDALTVLSWNVRLFDLYNWRKDKGTRDAIFATLKQEDADVLCLQEFFHSTEPKLFPSRDHLLKEHGYRAVHTHYTASLSRSKFYGIATFSKNPITAKGEILFPENPNNICIWTDIRFGADTLRVYNAHLASYHFGDDDYRFIDSLDTNTDGETLKRGGLRILKLLRRGMRQRAGEVERIAEHVRQSPHPVVFCGDINDVPMSYGYHTLRGPLRDAFRESGRGTGSTYVGRLPNLRIDHILHDDRLESWGYRTLQEELSDHRGITCRMAFAR